MVPKFMKHGPDQCRTLGDACLDRSPGVVVGTVQVGVVAMLGRRSGPSVSGFLLHTTRSSMEDATGMEAELHIAVPRSVLCT